ncbi:MAG: hypothetical protein R3Y18_01165 [Bacillota bacterium]
MKIHYLETPIFSLHQMGKTAGGKKTKKFCNGYLDKNSIGGKNEYQH